MSFLVAPTRLLHPQGLDLQLQGQPRIAVCRAVHRIHGQRHHASVSSISSPFLSPTSVPLGLLLDPCHASVSPFASCPSYVWLRPWLVVINRQTRNFFFA